MNKWLKSMAMVSGVLLMNINLWAESSMGYVPGEIIVKFKPEISTSIFFSKKDASTLGLTPKREIKLAHVNLSVLGVNHEKSFKAILARLNNNPDVLFAEPNYLYSIALMPKLKKNYHQKLNKLSPPALEEFNLTDPDDPSFNKLWGLKNTGGNEPQGENNGVVGADINALLAWDLTTGSDQIKIAVIDTGVDYTHQDLVQNVDFQKGYNFVNDTKDAMDDHGHGTHVSGTIGALHNNKIGVAGVMARVSIIPLKFLDATGSGSLESALKAIDYATELNVDVMSNSWGGGGRSEALYEAIKRASDKGIIFTAAAGNSSTNNDTSPSYPASYDLPNIISVAALTAQNTLAYFSSYGRNSVHIAAPGHNILSTVKGGKYEVMSGTSMATPHVSGVLGLLLAHEGRLPFTLLKERLAMTGVQVQGLRGKTQTASRIDAYNLLTDTRPTRSGPDNTKWRVIALEQPFESEHPYKENGNIQKRYEFKGAKYIRVKIAKFDLESGFDFVSISDGAHNLIEKITGGGENYVTDYVEGETLELSFISDRSINKWGHRILEVEVQ